MYIYYFIYTNLPAVKGIEGLQDSVQGRSIYIFTHMYIYIHIYEYILLSLHEFTCR